MLSKYSYILYLVTACVSASAQDLMSIADKTSVPQEEYVTGTFKTTRNINFHTLETLGKHTLDFRISHRFGPMNSGSYELWGLDQTANIRL